MSQIVTTRTTAIAEIPAEPKFSPHLASAVRDVLNPHPAIAGQPVTVPEHTLLEAQATGRLYDCICAPGEFVAWKCRLLPLNAAVRNPQATLDFEAKAHAIASACAAVPVAVLTPVTQRLAMQTFKFPRRGGRA